MKDKNSEKDDKNMILKIMRYCDGDLDPDQMKTVAAEIERDPKLQAIENDMRICAAAAKATMNAIGETPVPLKLVRTILRRPAGSRGALLVSSGIPDLADLSS